MAVVAKLQGGLPLQISSMVYAIYIYRGVVHGLATLRYFNIIIANSG